MNRGNSVFARITPRVVNPPGGNAPVEANDIFLHALFARITLTNNEVIEFETRYDQETNTIELNIPSHSLPLLDQITGIQRGENFKTFIDWLIGSRTLAQVDTKDKDFVTASLLQVWFGAQSINVEGFRLILSLPACDASDVGYNLKTSADFAGRLRISVIWMFLAGSNTSFDLRTTATVSDATGGSPVTVLQDTNISTFNLVAKDVRETEILDTGDIIGGGNIVNFLIHRNYIGSPDPKTETVGIVGLKVRLIESG